MCGRERGGVRREPAHRRLVRAVVVAADDARAVDEDELRAVEEGAVTPGRLLRAWNLHGRELEPADGQGIEGFRPCRHETPGLVRAEGRGVTDQDLRRVVGGS